MIFPTRKRSWILPLPLPPPPPKHFQRDRDDTGTRSTFPRFSARRSMFFVLFWSSLRFSLSFFAFASRMRFLRFFVSVFSSGFPPLPLLFFLLNNDLVKTTMKRRRTSRPIARLARVGPHLNRERRQVSPPSRVKMKIFECGGKRSIKMSSETRRACTTRRDSIRCFLAPRGEGTFSTSIFAPRVFA